MRLLILIPLIFSCSMAHADCDKEELLNKLIEFHKSEDRLTRSEGLYAVQAVYRSQEQVYRDLADQEHLKTELEIERSAITRMIEECEETK